MSVQGDGRPPARGAFDKTTVDRWQVFGGMAGVAALLLSVVSGIKNLVPLSLIAAGVVTLVGVVLLYRWGRRPQRNVTRHFALPVLITVVGAATAGVLVGLELRSPAGVGAADAATTTTTTGRGDTAQDGRPQGGGPAELRNEHVTLNSDSHIDLDTTTAESRGVTKAQTDDTDLHFILGIFAAEQLAVVPARPTYRDCVDATALTDHLPNEQVDDGVAFCVKTTEGRWAGVTVTEATKVGATVLEFDLVVWEE